MRAIKYILSLSFLFNAEAGGSRQSVELMSFNIKPEIQKKTADELLGHRTLSHFHLNSQSRSAFYLYKFVREQLPKEHLDKVDTISKAILNAANKFQIDPFLIAAVIKTESHYHPYMIGSVGEMGLMQIRPTTAQWLCRQLNLNYLGDRELKNVSFNIYLGTAYIAYLYKRYNNMWHTLTAYNMGPRNLNMNLKSNKQPKEYVTKVSRSYKMAYNAMISNSRLVIALAD